MSIKNGTTINLTVTSVSDPMSIDNTYDELVSAIKPIDTNKPSSRPADTDSSSSSYTLIIASTYALFTSSALPSVLT